MPSMPWTATQHIDRDRHYLVMATRSRITSRRHLPPMIAATQTLWAGLAATGGLLGYSMRADLIKATLATLTVWQDPASLAAFVRAEQHATVVAATRHWMRDSAFANWSAAGAELPPQWATADRHLDATRAARP